MQIDRRKLLIGAGAGLAWPAAIARAWAVDADVRTGSIKDVEHVVILMQENRGFDHYFGTMAGVRGFGDRFPIPSVSGGTVWTQQQDLAAERPLLPFRLDTQATFELICAEGTPHTWPDAQAAWDEGRMSHWPIAKTQRSMGHYAREDIPFQHALAEAFTICDAYHCSIQTGTNTNRLFLWSGTNDPAGTHGGPAIGNSHDSLPKDGGWPDGYRWTTYVERLQAAGVNWRIYEDMADNFTDNPLAGFQRIRDAYAAGADGADHDLIKRGFSTQKLDRLRADVLAGQLPQLSYIVAGASDSEHPAASSPAQGADYTARVLDALTADPKVWSRTVLLVMFDENDGFFDHAPPPSPPSRDASGALAGGSTVATEGEYHLVHSVADAALEKPEFMGRPYGLGPRVPMTVISPWSRGGWVNSETFDHTSVIRFLEACFGVPEPNISEWRRAVCGDLTSAFDFRSPNRSVQPLLPATGKLAAQAAMLNVRPAATPPADHAVPTQALGVRRSRALGYSLEARSALAGDRVQLSFVNSGRLGAVFHVYDRLHLDRVPRRYTVGAGHSIEGSWALGEGGRYDLWVLGPDGFHRRIAGAATDAIEVTLRSDRDGMLRLAAANQGLVDRSVTIRQMAYGTRSRTIQVQAGRSISDRQSTAASYGWYDLALSTNNGFTRRFAGRLHTGRDGLSDPAMGGPALMRNS